MENNNMKGKKLKKDINMLGSIYMTPDGKIYSLYGGWHKYFFSQIPKKSNVYKKIVDSYGTKEGKKVRAVAIKVILKHGKWQIKK